MTKKRKTDDSAYESRSKLTNRGLRLNAIERLENEKNKPKIEEKIFVSSIKLFPNRKPLLIEVKKSATKKEIAEIITKRMTVAEHNPFRKI